MRRCFHTLLLIFLVLGLVLGWKGMGVAPALAQDEEEVAEEDEWETVDEEQAAEEEKEKAKAAAKQEAAQKEAAKKAKEEAEKAAKQEAEKAAKQEADRKAAQKATPTQADTDVEEEPEDAFEPAEETKPVKSEAPKPKEAPKPESKPEPTKQAAAESDEEELILEPELETISETTTKETSKPSMAQESAEEEYTEEEGIDEEWEEVSSDEQEQNITKAEKELEEAQKIPTVLTNLEECKRVALMNDRRVQVALREIRFQRCKILQAERDFLPGVKGTYEKQEGASDQGSGKSDAIFSGLKYGLEGTQTVFNGGKLVYALKQEKTKLAVAKKKFEQSRQEAIAKVEKAYYELVKAQMIFQIQTDLSKSAEAALSFSREAYRQGLNPYHDFLNVQSQTDQTYYQLLSSQQDIALAELELRNACNVDASVGIQINAVLTFTDFDFNYSLDECLALALKNRPDLAVNELTTLSDLFGIRLAVAETMPKVEVVGNVGKTGQAQQGTPLELGDEWDLKFQATWVLGANSGQYGLEKKKSIPKKFGSTDSVKDSKTQSLSISLFDKLEKLSDVAKSQVQKATSEADLMELRGKVCKEVDENYFNYQKAMTSVTASLSKIKFREKDLEINRAKQMMNDVPLSQVLTAELQLGEERVNYVKALSDYYTSISGLFKAMGLSK